MSERDLPFVVREHRTHFPEGFFARLGDSFLHEYYRSFLTSPASRARMAEVGGTAAGYLVGITDPTAHRAHVLHVHGRRLVVHAVAAMLRHPNLGLVFARTRLRRYARRLLRLGRRAAVTGGPVSSTEAVAVLAHVVVTESAQSRGIGSTLIGWFDEQAARAGRDRLMLVTSSGPGGAGPYYERSGWTACGQHRTPDGVYLTTYRRDVGAHRRPAPDPREGTA